jgi:hypothetical protein
MNPNTESLCCQINNSKPNSQTNNPDSSTKTFQKNDRVLVNAVDIAQEAIIQKIPKTTARPIFQSYQAYIQYLQGKR